MGSNLPLYLELRPDPQMVPTRAKGRNPKP